MQYYRLFIDLPCEPSVAKDILGEFKKLALPWEKIKVSQLDQIHLTLKFLGDTPLDRLEPIIAALGEVKLSSKDMVIECEKPLIFSPHHPRVLAIGIKNNEQLNLLFTQIEEILWQENLAHKEIRQFKPHLTLGRIKQDCTLDELKSFNQWSVKHFSFGANLFELQESKLNPQGPVYNCLQSYDL